jgi:endo-1,4-beta-mannosidase
MRSISTPPFRRPSLVMSRLVLLITLFLAPALFAAPAELIREIKPLSVRGVNYYPRDTAWGRMWTEIPTEAWEQDMAAAARLGVNTVRTFLIFRPDDVAKGLATEDGTPTPAYHEKHQRLLEAGWKHGIRFVLCFEFSPSILKAPDATQRWQRAMRSIAYSLRDDGRVLVWDLMNEPESDEKWTEATKAYLKGAKAFIKEVDPHHLTSIGITYRTDRLQEIGLPEVLQYHEYGTGKKSAHLGPGPVRKTINNQRMKPTERPLIIGEFGMCTARDPQHGTSPELVPKLNDAAGTEADQAQVYSAVLEAVKDERIGGAIAWCLYDYPIKNPNESHFGLIRLDGSEKPAAKALRDAFIAWSKSP